MGTKQSLSRARSIPVNRGTTHAQRSPSVSVSPLATLQMQAATADPQVASPGTLLALQRLYGNQAVQRLCAPSLALTRTQRSSAAAQAPVQRSPGATLQRSDAVAAQSNRQPLKASSAPLNRIHRSFVKPNKTHYAVTPGVAQRSRSEDVPDKYASAQNNRWGAETLQTKPAKRVSSPSSVRRPVLRSSRLPTLRRRIQATLIVGAADDPYEREAERVAAQVSGVRTAPARASVSVQRTSHAPAMGLEGGEAGRELEHQIASTHGGALLPNETRIFMERRIGADFSGVHIHASAQAAQLNRSLGAQAFTHGSNVFMGEGSYNPTSSSGRHLLAHELTHVVQQNAATVSRAPAEAQSPKPDVPAAQRVSRRVQRNVGFEFETNNLITKRGNGGPLPAAGFADAGAAATAFNDPNATRIDKGAHLLEHNTNDMTIEADDRMGGSDLEVVTTHFPETVPGRARLAAVMADLAALVVASTGVGATAGHHVPAEALDGNNNFNTVMHDAMWVGNWGTATTAPQVTVGVRVGNIGDIVKDLHGAPGETGPEQAARDPGRTRMRRPDAVNPALPRALGPLDETQTPINGATLAHNAVAAYQGANAGAPGGPELEGILTIMYTYREGVQHKQAFLKQHTPLMAKTDLATIWTTLPAPVKTYYGRTNWKGMTRLEQLFAMAPGYAAQMNQPLFNVNALLDENNNPLGQRQWYHKLTLRSWVRGIALRNHSSGEAIKQFFRSGKGGTFRRGVDQLRTANFPGRPANQQVEGDGALGANMDADATNPLTRLPVFELRAANRPIRYADLGPWALEVFDYIRSLNANPGGGHARMGARAGYGM